MTPGTILFDDEFKFEDGSTGEKLFVVLSDGAGGEYVVAKTTSNGSRYGNVYGCQTNDRFLSFFFPCSTKCFKLDTWVQLETFYGFEAGDLMQKVVNQEIKRIGVLPATLTRALISCAANSDDISMHQLGLIQP